jgi:hypothetical protein
MKSSFHSLVPFLPVFCNCQLSSIPSSSPSRLASQDSTLHSTSSLLTQVKVKVTLRLTVSQSVNLGVEPHLGLMTRYLLLFDSYGLVFCGAPLWREDGSVFYICCWPLPAQSFLGPSPLVLATIFNCLRFETSLFVASYDCSLNCWALLYNCFAWTPQKTLSSVVPCCLRHVYHTIA